MASLYFPRIRVLLQILGTIQAPSTRIRRFLYPQILLCGYTQRPRMSAVYARCIRRFLYTISRVEISVYAVYPDTCGRSYQYIFVYADVTVSENYRRLSFLCNAHALLTNPLRCPNTNRIRVDGRIRFVYAMCGHRYFCIRIKKFADTKISGYVWTGP